MEDKYEIRPDSDGQFRRQDSLFRNFISRDPNTRFSAEKGRYALYLTPGCPWSHRTIIVRAMKHLEDIIDFYCCHNTMGDQGWYFSGEDVSLPADPLYGFHTIKQLYLKADPNYNGRITVPVLWDKKTGTLVNNESSDIIRMLTFEFDDLLPVEDREASRPGGGLYPESLRVDIDHLNDWVYHSVNNGVYKTGFATNQEVYERHLFPLFEGLDRLESRLLNGGPFIMGKHITEADVRLFVTLIRFDLAYVSIFQCNLKTLRHDYPNLYLYLRRLYWDHGEETRGAFYKTTEPYLGTYATGYAHARRKMLGGPAIIPRGPLVLIDELKAEEQL